MDGACWIHNTESSLSLDSSSICPTNYERYQTQLRKTVFHILSSYPLQIPQIWFKIMFLQIDKVRRQNFICKKLRHWLNSGYILNIILRLSNYIPSIYRAYIYISEGVQASFCSRLFSPHSTYSWYGSLMVASQWVWHHPAITTIPAPHENQEQRSGFVQTGLFHQVKALLQTAHCISLDVLILKAIQLNSMQQSIPVSSWEIQPQQKIDTRTLGVEFNNICWELQCSPCGL